MGALRFRQRQGGFTLIELMVVVAIVAFVSAAVVPSISLTLLRNRQREAANLIIQGVFAARSRAARTGRCQQLLVFPGDAALKGGSGGAVAVLGSRLGFRCSQAIAMADFQPLWVKSIGGGNILGAARAAIVGEDVGIFQAIADDGTVTAAGGGPVTIHFEPSGGLLEGMGYLFEMRAYDAGKVEVGAKYRRCIDLRAGGIVHYGQVHTDGEGNTICE